MCAGQDASPGRKAEQDEDVGVQKAAGATDCRSIFDSYELLSIKP